MTNTTPEKEYDNLNDWLHFSFDQLMKNVYTCLPGIISSYDRTTRRAVVKIGVVKLNTDGTQTSYPAIADVPILFPASNRYLFSFPLEDGDPILILFSQRGLQIFKQTYEESVPTKSSFFSFTDAVGIPGFGQLSTSVVDPAALSMQTTDGQTYIALKDGDIHIKALNITDRDWETN